MELFYIFYVLIGAISWSGKVYATCHPFDLHRYGRRLFCEDENDQPLPCTDGSSLYYGVELINMTVYISCNKWYHPKGKKTSQIVYCVEGDWSEPLIECIPKCDKYPANMRPFGPENTKSFKWYVELVRKTPIYGKRDFYKGIILNEREIYTADEFCFNEVADEFVVAFNSPRGYFNHTTLMRSSTIGSSCIAFLDMRKSINFNNDHKPVCSDSLDIGFEHTAPLGVYGGHTCINLPFEPEKFESRCFQIINQSSKNVNCSKSNHHTILIRCQLGYESQKRLTDTKNIYIFRCLSAYGIYRWNAEHMDNDCVLTCGEIDKEYIPPVTPLLFRGSHIQTISAPWHVGIYEKEGDNIEQVCGGTIIHSNIIISAAHCFYDDSMNVVNTVSSYLVAAGKKYRSFDAVEKYAAYADVKEIFIPPNYLVEKQQNDLAILVLDSHFDYSSHIKPVCVDWKSYTNSDIPEGTIGRIVGWGATSSEDKSSPELQTISLRTLTRRQCERRVKPKHKNEVTGDKFCAVNENNATACRGDSGGGFVVKKKFGSTERYVLAGIVSLGVDYKKYCTDGFLSLFTNIQLYKDIIQEYISEARNIEYFENNRGEYPYLS